MDRTELLNSADKFLRDPSVSSASLSKRVAFLESKGLTTLEIETAIQNANNETNGVPPKIPFRTQSNTASHFRETSVMPPGNGVGWKDVLLGIIGVSGLGYASFVLHG